MKYKKYPKYKSSGIEWLGEVPEHWEVRRLKRVIENYVNGVWGSEPTGVNDTIVVRVADFDYDKLKIKDTDFTKRNIKPEDKIKRKLNSGDLLIERSGGGDNQPVGRVVIFDKDFESVCSNFITKLTISKQVNNKFILYVFSYLYNTKINMKSIKQTTGIQNLNLEQYLLEKIFLPPLSEQKAIATFLDKATEKIDNLIQKEEELIKLLEEKKEALITKAVTKGLNEKAKMKDSGIEWLGKIPEHWKVRKLKYLINGKLQYGANESGQTYNPNLPRYIRITDFDQNGKLANKNKLSLSWEKAKNYLLKKGDVLFARSGATVGKTFQFNPEKLEDKYYAFAGYLIKAEPNKKIITSDFLYFFTTSKAYKNWKDYIFSKSTIENIGADKYSELILPLPPLQEQKAIAKYLDKKLAKIDKLIEKSKKAIELLKEKKEALITNAVTGKIDVRENYEA